MTDFDRRAAPRPASLVDVDRAIGEWRRGMPVVVHAGAARALILPVEGLSDRELAHTRWTMAGAGEIVITARRARALGLNAPRDAPVAFALTNGMTAEAIRGLVDPLEPQTVTASALTIPPDTGDSATRGELRLAGIELAKLAELLPAALIAPLRRSAVATAQDEADALGNPLAVHASSILIYRRQSVATLRRIADARVPLTDALETEIVAFRPGDGGPDHLAILVGGAAPPNGEERPPLVRLHSACVTGDLLGSLRCDCGDQLRGALARIAEEGRGVVLYLAQEGRGIGIANKLRAYRLQDAGFDTLDANGQLGFEDDERSFLVAAAMLRALGHERVRLMTNNPEKVAALTACGITVTERVPHVFAANEHNRDYLETKAVRAGHLL